MTPLYLEAMHLCATTLINNFLPPRREVRRLISYCLAFVIVQAERCSSCPLRCWIQLYSQAQRGLHNKECWLHVWFSQTQFYSICGTLHSSYLCETLTKTQLIQANCSTLRRSTESQCFEFEVDPVRTPSSE